MNADRKARLEAAGFKVGTVEEFLGLSDVEMQLIDMKIAMGAEIKQRRARRKLTQKKLAALVGSSQPRVANLEQGLGSMDALVSALMVLGVSKRQVGNLVAA